MAAKLALCQLQHRAVGHLLGAPPLLGDPPLLGAPPLLGDASASASAASLIKPWLLSNPVICHQKPKWNTLVSRISSIKAANLQKDQRVETLCFQNQKLHGLQKKILRYLFMPFVIR